MEQWISDWLNSQKFSFAYKIGDNEVWDNDKHKVVVHPAIGLRLMYPVNYYSKKYFKEAIMKDLAAQEI